MEELVCRLQSETPEKWQDLKSFYQGKRVIITGGMGFIGSNLAIALVALGAEVLIVDSMIPDYGGNEFNIRPVADKVRINISDVRDRTSMDFLVRQCELLFNLAGSLSHVDSMKDPFTDLEINAVSQLSILESCRKYNPTVKILFAGTRGQYGRTHGKPVNEDYPMRPCDVNGINNVAGEAYHLLYNDVYGIRACSLRLTNTFGPRHQMKHPRQGVLNWFIRQLIDGQTIKLYGTGQQIRDTNYVADVVEAMLLAMASEETNGKAFNIGGEPLSLLQFVQLAIEVNGSGKYELVPFPENSLKIEVGDYIADYTRFKQTVGWEPRTPAKEGIQRTLDYYRKFKEYYW